MTDPPTRIAEIRKRHDSGKPLRRNDFEWLLARIEELEGQLAKRNSEVTDG